MPGTSPDSGEEASTPLPAWLALCVFCWISPHPDLCLAPSFRHMDLHSMLPPVPAIYLFALRSNYLSQINVSQGPGLGEGGTHFSGRLAHWLLVRFSHWVVGAGSRLKGERKGEARMFPVHPHLPLRTPLLQGPSPAAPLPPCGPDPTGQPLPLWFPLLCSGMYSLPLSLQRLAAAAVTANLWGVSPSVCPQCPLGTFGTSSPY